MERRFNRPYSTDRQNQHSRYPPPYESVEELEHQSPNRDQNYRQESRTPNQTQPASTSASQRVPPAVVEEDERTMSSWFTRVASDDRTKFAATALVSGAVVAGAILGYQHVRRQERVEDLKASIPPLDERHTAEKV